MTCFVIESKVFRVHCMKLYMGSRGLAPLIRHWLEVSGYLHFQDALRCERAPSIHWTGSLVDFRDGMDVLEKRKISFLYWDSNTRPSSPWPIHYTNYDVFFLITGVEISCYALRCLVEKQHDFDVYLYWRKQLILVVVNNTLTRSQVSALYVCSTFLGNDLKDR